MPKAGRKAGAYTQSLRLFRLLDHLRGRRYGATYEDLAATFEVTERQIRRDLQIVEDAGHELERTPGHDSRTRVRLCAAPTRTVALTRLERFALLAVRRVFDVLDGTPFEEHVLSLHDKLRGTFSDEELRDLDVLAERFIYVPDGGTKSYQGRGDLVDDLLTGTLRRERVRYRYESPDAHRPTGLLEPYAMLLYRQGLYVIGRTLDASGSTPPDRRPHVYAAERFCETEWLRGARFEVPASFRPERFFDSTFGIFMGDQVVHVVVDFDRTVARYVLARRWHRSQKTTPLARGGVRLELDLNDTKQLQSWVLSFGPHARAVEPPQLVERIAGELHELAKVYGVKPPAAVAAATARAR